MSQPYTVAVVEIDESGNFMREKVTVNDALIKLLRFSRMYQHSECTIELRHLPPDAEALRASRSEIDVAGDVGALRWTKTSGSQRSDTFAAESD